MVGRRIRLLPAALVALVLFTASGAASSIDFRLYPEAAQDCMYQASNSSQCESGNVPATNSCLCRNGGNFITNTAACLGRSARNTLDDVYSTMKGACSDSETPISITEDEFMAAADESTSTTTSATTSSSATATTTTPPPTPTNSDEEEEKDEGSSGLSTGAMAGVIAGAIGGCAVLAAVAWFIFRKRRRLGEESHPMLPQQAHISMVPSGRESTAYYGSPPDTGAWPKKDWRSSPDLRNSDIRNSGFNWESPAHLSYPSGTLAPSPPPIQELDGSRDSQIFPPGSTEAPVEMGGTPIATTPPPPPPPPPPAQQPPAGPPQYQAYNPGQQQQQHPGSAWNPQQR